MRDPHLERTRASTRRQSTYRIAACLEEFASEPDRPTCCPEEQNGSDASSRGACRDRIIPNCASLSGGLDLVALGESPLWSDTGTDPTFNCCLCCLCCGAEFGYQSTTLKSVTAARERWVAKGRPWARPDNETRRVDATAWLAKFPGSSQMRV